MNSIINKIKNIAQHKIIFKAKEIDNKKKFPNFISNFFDVGDLKLLLGYHSSLKSLSAKHEAEFYYFATKYCANIRNYFLVSIGMVGAGIFKYGTNNQKKNFIKNTVNKNEIYALALTEKNAGSDLNSIKTKYKFENNKFVINGEKTWITFGDKAKNFLLLANGEFGLLLFCVRKNKSIKSNQLKNIISNKASSIGTIKIKNLILNHEDILGGKQYLTLEALDYILVNGRAIASISASAMAEAALEEAIAYSKNRIQFGKRIFQFQQIQSILTNVSIDIEAAKSLTEKSFAEKRKDFIKGRYLCNSSKILASKMINKTTYNLMNVFGANSNYKKFNIERYDREAKGFLFIEGTSQILSQLISSYLISKY